MTALKSLTFTTLPKAGANPVLNRRTATISRLEEQKLLLNDPSYIRVSQRWTKKDGERVPVERRQRVTPWWRLSTYLIIVGGPLTFLCSRDSRALKYRASTVDSLGEILRWESPANEKAICSVFKTLAHGYLPHRRSINRRYLCNNA